MKGGGGRQVPFLKAKLVKACGGRVEEPRIKPAKDKTNGKQKRGTGFPGRKKGISLKRGGKVQERFW